MFVTSIARGSNYHIRSLCINAHTYNLSFQYIYTCIYIYIWLYNVYILMYQCKMIWNHYYQSTIEWNQRNYHKILQDIFWPSLMQISTLCLWILLLYVHIKNELQKRDFLSPKFIFIQIRSNLIKVILKKKPDLLLNIYVLHFKKTISSTTNIQLRITKV